MIEIVMPDLGPDMEEARISFWLVEAGEHVDKGTNLVEVTTEKSTFNVSATIAGVVTEIIVFEGETVPVGNVLGRIEEEL